MHQGRCARGGCCSMQNQNRRVISYARRGTKARDKALEERRATRVFFGRHRRVLVVQRYRIEDGIEAAAGLRPFRNNNVMIAYLKTSASRVALLLLGTLSRRGLSTGALSA